MAIWKKHQCSLAQKVGPGNTVPLQKLGGPWPLRNWNNFFPLIELHCVSSQHCIGLSNSLSAPHQKIKGGAENAGPYTLRTHPLQILKFPLPCTRTQHRPPLSSIFPFDFTTGPNQSVILKSYGTQRVIHLKVSVLPNKHTQIYWNRLKSQRALGFKVSMKPKPFKQIKFQIKQAM